MLNVVRIHCFVPVVIYVEKGKTADECSLAKFIINDIIWHSRVSAGLSCIDATNYYYSITHAIVSMVFQAFGVPLESVEAMLIAVEEMKYFLWTAYEDSKNLA